MDEEEASPVVSPEEVLRVVRETPNPLMDRLGIEWLELDPDRIVARIPVAGNTQPYGVVHGGATAALCETVGSFGTALVAGFDRISVGIALTVNHLRSVREGHITATGVPLHVGRSTAVWDMRVEDDEGRLVAVSRLTLAIRDPAPARP
ncbi:MAG: PaaI family thioesterase [Actinomycetota bacterium]|nr:PaaI family thioesterase [Actinomycetota bacterium]